MPKCSLFMQQIILRGISFIDTVATLSKLDFNKLPLCSSSLSLVSFLDPENYFVHFVSLSLWCVSQTSSCLWWCIFALHQQQHEGKQWKWTLHTSCLAVDMSFLSTPMHLHWRHSIMPSTGPLGENTNISAWQGEGRSQIFTLESAVRSLCSQTKEDLKVRERYLAIWVSLGFLTWLRPWVFPVRSHA